MDVIVGTAGHIDHGKTALVLALTGTDADRLPEEKRRGITIDLGFAEMQIGDTHFGFVDVPGHERFVKNMLAGARGIDIVLLVVAADEGVMPQTREHFDICRLLGIEHGIIALTKSDLVDAETLELAMLETAELVEDSFLSDASVVPISAKTGDGIGPLRDALLNAASQITRGDNPFVTRFPIDRSFSMKGFGAVVTGTLASGSIALGDDLDLLPPGKRVRVRGLQTHGRGVEAASRGQRVAINLGGIAHTQITRGMTLVATDALRPVQTIDAEIAVLDDSSRQLRSRQRVRLHLGTSETLARVRVLKDTGEIAPGESGFARLTLESPIVAVPGERFIIRRYSPHATIAGGRVAAVTGERIRRKEFASLGERHASFLNADETSQVQMLIGEAAAGGISRYVIQRATGLDLSVIDAAVKAGIESQITIDAGGRFLSAETFHSLGSAAADAIAQFHNREPLARGMSMEMLRDAAFPRVAFEIANAVIRALETSGKIAVERDIVRIAERRLTLSDEGTLFIDRLTAIYRRSKLEAPKLADALSEARSDTQIDFAQSQKLLKLVVWAGKLVKITDDIYLDAEILTALIAKLRERAAADEPSIEVSTFKAIAGVSRKYAIPLLEYFDRERVTRRIGESRVIL